MVEVGKGGLEGFAVVGVGCGFEVAQHAGAGEFEVFADFAGGFVGSAYLPYGYNDLTHAEQRMVFQFAGIAIQNIAAEFLPQWGPLVRKLRINKIIPEWWVSKREE